MSEAFAEADFRGEDDDILEMIEAAREALDDLEKGVLDRNPDSRTFGLRGDLTAVELLRRARRGTRDGYPTRSIGSGGGPSSDVFDDEETGQRVVLPPRSDPVADLVIARNDPDRAKADPIRRRAADLKRLVRGAVGNLTVAVGTLSKAEPPKAVAEPACRVHAALGLWAAVHRGDRCRWCDDFFRAEGVDPPEDLLRARDEGKRITNRMVKEALKPRAPRQRGKRRRKAGARQ